ncbi:mucin-17-like isoform X2 [Oryza brachyantha]|uniref:mucin-17-like isoform X2 n=1 Tax=Oryza brachyantha TaxID=4533 RepID=UPI001AD996B4|nr:mucin-17-like isoform X2 [Oryza brachyantha]
MASSPAAATPRPESTNTPSHSPAPPLQGNPSLTADAPPEPSPPDHATPISPRPPGEGTEERPEADAPLPSTAPAIGGTPGAADSPPSFSSLEVATSAASPALVAAAAGWPSSPPLLPPAEAAEFYPEAPSSPSSSYETADDASPASPPPTPPPLVLCASPDSSFTDPAEMASPACDPMGADEGSHAAPEPPTPPLESGPEEFQQKQQPHPPRAIHPECVSSEHAELPSLPPTSPAEITPTLPDVTDIDAVAGTPEKASGSTAEMEVMDGTEIDALAGTPEETPGSMSAMEAMDATEMDAVAGKPEDAPGSTAEMDAVAGKPEEAPGSTAAMEATEMDAVAGKPEEAPGSTAAMEAMDATEIDAVSGKPEESPGSTVAMEVMDATVIDAVAGMPEEAPGSTAAMEVTDVTKIDAVAGTPEEAPGPTVAMEVTYGETGSAAVSVSLVLDSGEEVSLQKSMQKPSSPTVNTEPESMERPCPPTMNTEPCSPEMVSLGFQLQQPHSPATAHPEYDGSEHVELPLRPTSLAKTAHTLADAADIDVVPGTTEEALGSTAAMEVTDSAKIDVLTGIPEEAPSSTLAMEVMYGETDIVAVSVSPLLENGEEGSLQVSMQRPSSPAMKPESMERPCPPTVDTKPCSPEMAPLGFQMPQQQQQHPPATAPSECDSSEHAELPLPPTSLAEITHTLPNAADINAVAGTPEDLGSMTTMEVMHAAKIDVVAGMPEEAPNSTLAMEVIYRETDTAAISVSPVLDSGKEGSLQESMEKPSYPMMDPEPESIQRSSSPTVDTEPSLPEMAPPGFQQQQQQSHLPSTTPPECDSLEHAELPLPPTSPAEITHTLRDAAEIDVIAGTPEEAPNSALAVMVTYRKTDTSEISVPPVVENAEEGPLQESMQRPSSPTMVTKPCSPDMAPPGFENCKASWLPVPPPTPPGQSMPSLPVAAAPKGLVVMPEEVVESVPSLEALDAEKPSSIMQAEPSSPDMPPPGFENFKSSWLPLPTTPPVSTTEVLPDVVVTKAVEAPIEEAFGPLPALELMNMDTDTAHNMFPTEGSEGLLQKPLLKLPSPVAQSEPYSQDEMAPPGFENFKSSSEPCSVEEIARPVFDNFKSSSEPCSPVEMAPPGFENFKSSWPPHPSLPQTAYMSPDAATRDALAATVEEVTGPPPALEAMDVDVGAIHPPPPPFDSGLESLQEPLPRVPSPIMQETSCSPDRAPPGFETYKSSQLLLPSPSLAQTTNDQQDQLVTKPISVIEEAPQPLHSVELMGANMDTAPPSLLSSESGPDGPFPQQFPCLPSPAEKGTTTCLPDMVHSGSDDLESSQLLPPPVVISTIQTPDGLADAPAVDRVAVASEESPQRPLVSRGMEDGTVPIQSSPLENASEGSLPQVESQVHSPTAQAVDSLLDAPGSKSVAVASEMSQPPQAANTDFVSTTAMQPQSKGIVDESLQLPQHPASSTAHAAPCLQDSVLLVPPPPSPFLNKEIGQMVCGSCRVLLAYFRGADHVHCTCCQTMNLVLEAHEVGNVHCGHCETLLMYPFGAPSVKCSLCLFVTEIGERNVRPRLSIEQAVPPHPSEVQKSELTHKT